MELPNRFTVLQEDLSIEEKWELFSISVKASAETVIGRRRGTNRERWISDRAWNLIDDRKKAKRKKTGHIQEQKHRLRLSTIENLTRRLVKKSCQRDKKDWIESKCTEAQEAASRKDSRSLYSAVRQLTGIKDNTNVPIIAKGWRPASNRERAELKIKRAL